MFMKVTEFKFFIFVSLIILSNLFTTNNVVNSKQKSILKMFCLQSVKREMLKAEVAYSEDLANETCQCYYERFIETSSHQDAKTKCKLEAQKNFQS